MPQDYIDVSENSGMKLRHRVGRIRFLPIRGTGRLSRLLGRLIPAPVPMGPCIIGTLHGFRMIVDPVLDRGLERDLFFYGTYEEGTLRAMYDILKPGDTFVDIGANIGLMSLHAAHILNGDGRVLSFEPMPDTFEILTANIALNRFDIVEAVHTAVGAERGTVAIHDNRAMNRGSASLIRPARSESSHSVSISRLDDLLLERGIDRIHCMKIDVEGWEFEVFKGAAHTLSGPDAPVCIFECSAQHPTQGGTNRDIYRFLRSINAYRLFRLARGKERPSRLVEIETEDRLPDHDNVFCFLSSHIEAGRFPSHR